MRSIEDALTDGGAHVMLEINSADDPADNAGPFAATFYTARLTVSGGGAR